MDLKCCVISSLNVDEVTGPRKLLSDWSEIIDNKEFKGQNIIPTTLFKLVDSAAVKYYNSDDHNRVTMENSTHNGINDNFDNAQIEKMDTSVDSVEHIESKFDVTADESLADLDKPLKDTYSSLFIPSAKQLKEKFALTGNSSRGVKRKGSVDSHPMNANIKDILDS